MGVFQSAYPPNSPPGCSQSITTKMCASSREKQVSARFFCVIVFLRKGSSHELCTPTRPVNSPPRARFCGPNSKGRARGGLVTSLALRPAHHRDFHMGEFLPADTFRGNVLLLAKTRRIPSRSIPEGTHVSSSFPPSPNALPEPLAYVCPHLMNSDALKPLYQRHWRACTAYNNTWDENAVTWERNTLDRVPAHVRVLQRCHWSAGYSRPRKGEFFSYNNEL